MKWSSITLYRPVTEPFNHVKFDTMAEAKAAEKAHEEAILKGTVYQCVSSVLGKGCGAFSTLAESEGIQRMYYVSPYSCTGGDYYLPDEVLVVCPKCSNRNRTYDTTERRTIKPALKSCSTEYDR